LNRDQNAQNQPTGTQNQPDPPKPQKSLSLRGAYILGAVCIIALVIALLLPVVAGRMGWDIGKGLNDTSADTSVTATAAPSATAASGSASASDKLTTCSQKIAALIAKEDDVKKNGTLRAFFYGTGGLAGDRYKKDVSISSADQVTGRNVNKELASLLGISAEDFQKSYAWTIAPNAQGDEYNGDTYGYSIYWCERALTSADANAQVDVLRYDTKTQTFQKGTMTAKYADNSNVALQGGSFQAK